MNLPFFIARRYLLRQKGTFSSFITRLAIVATALSVAVMIIAMGIITGFQQRIREKLFSFWGHVHIVPHNTNPANLISASPIAIDTQLMQHVSRMPHVLQVAPFALRPAIVHANGQMEGVRLKGIRPDYRFSKGISFTGGTLDFSDTAYARQILMSQAMANRLRVNAGDKVLLYFLEPGARFPRVRKLEVAGLFHTGMDEVDHYFGVCDLRLLQRVNSWSAGDINGYQVELDDPFLADTMALTIYDRYITPPLYTESINVIYQNIFDWLRMQHINVRILIVIMSVVAVINLSAALLILIVDRARMVALLKTLGMPFQGIRMIFIALAGLIGLTGVAAGTALSLGLAWLQQQYGFLKLPESTYYMDRVPVEIVWWHVALIDIASLALCVFCMWLPTLYIRRIRPARTLQFQ